MADVFLKKQNTILVSIFISLALHSLIFLIKIVEGPPVIDLSDPNVKIKIIRTKSIVEARLPETAPPVDDAHLGAQNHRTNQETRLPPNRNHSKGADASSLANESERSGKGGKLQDKGIGNFLPTGSEIASYNDFIPDESIPTGKILDVNTTEYEYLGYVTAIRKNVDLAFYNPLSSLKDEPHVREKIKKGSKIRFSGRSVAQLTIEKSGLLSKVEIVESGGDKKINEAWSKILNLAAPFPPLPRHFKEETFVIKYVLYYDFIIRDEEKVRRYRF